MHGYMDTEPGYASPEPGYALPDSDGATLFLSLMRLRFPVSVTHAFTLRLRFYTPFTLLQSFYAFYVFCVL